MMAKCFHVVLNDQRVGPVESKPVIRCAKEKPELLPELLPELFAVFFQDFDEKSSALRYTDNSCEKDSKEKTFESEACTSVSVTK